MKELYKHDFNDDVSGKATVGNDELSLVFSVKISKQLEKLSAKFEAKDDMFSKIASKVIVLAKDYVAKLDNAVAPKVD
jgi:hypothetical protein